MSGGGLILAGLALAAAGFGGRALLRNLRPMQKTLQSILPQASKYYRGSFEETMSRREASLILGVSPNANPNRIKEAHKRIMLLNHPDKGGSPYIAAKINEAKDMMDKSK